MLVFGCITDVTNEYSQPIIFVTGPRPRTSRNKGHAKNTDSTVLGRKLNVSADSYTYCSCLSSCQCSANYTAYVFHT